MDILEITVLERLRADNRYYEEIEKTLMYRLEIIAVMRDARERGHREKYSKLQRRLERFERNFLGDWDSVVDLLSNSYRMLQERVLEVWQEHKESMTKI